jgi:hypothetical protein
MDSTPAREPRHAMQRGKPTLAAAPPMASRAAPDETTLAVDEDPGMTEIARALVSKAASLGRFYAVSPMKPEERAQLLKGAHGADGVRVYVEGESRNRRIVFAPEKPAPLPLRAAYPQDDELEG